MKNLLIIILSGVIISCTSNNVDQNINSNGELYSFKKETDSITPKQSKEIIKVLPTKIIEFAGNNWELPIYPPQCIDSIIFNSDNKTGLIYHCEMEDLNKMTYAISNDSLYIEEYENKDRPPEIHKKEKKKRSHKEEFDDDEINSFNKKRK